MDVEDKEVRTEAKDLRVVGEEGGSGGEGGEAAMAAAM